MALMKPTAPPKSTATVTVNPAIERYQLNLLSKADCPILLEMEAFAEANNFPIIGRLVGVFIETLAKTVGAKRIFEFGSGFGYSAYWFAKAVGEQGTVICSEADMQNQQKAEGYLKSAGLWDRVEFKAGMAQELFMATEGDFDICYNDVDKGDYPEIWTLAKDRIRPGGLYIADNVLWRGRVAVENYKEAFVGWTEAIKSHNQRVFDDPDFDTFINPTRDGVLVARKKT